jgi:quinolinate synthase
MIEHVAQAKPAQVAMITECSMAGNVAAEFPEVKFIQPCNLCPHMKRITLPRILACLQAGTPAVTVDPAVAHRARAALDRMLAVGRDARPAPAPGGLA